MAASSGDIGWGHLAPPPNNTREANALKIACLKYLIWGFYKRKIDCDQGAEQTGLTEMMIAQVSYENGLYFRKIPLNISAGVGQWMVLVSRDSRELLMRLLNTTAGRRALRYWLI